MRSSFAQPPTQGKTAKERADASFHNCIALRVALQDLEQWSLNKQRLPRVKFRNTFRCSNGGRFSAACPP